MAKKKNCRRTVDEVKIHEKAVKMRKMTDEQLVHYVEDRVEKARSEGKNERLAKATSLRKVNKVEEFIGFLQTEKIAGIGTITVNKIMKVAREHGYIQ